MKVFRLIFAALVAMFGLTGCLQMEQVVKLKSDGSGTVEETVVLSKAALATMEQMISGIGTGTADKKKEGATTVPDLYDEAKLKAAAAKMGEGVTFVSAKRVDNEQGKGFTAIYAFSDINKLKLDQNPGEALPDTGSPKPAGKKEPVTFHFEKGSPSQLTLKMPAPEFKPQPKNQPEGMEEMAMQMMKQMFKDMRIALAVEVDGTISETNAAYQDGSRVTLMDMDCKSEHSYSWV